MAMRTGGTLLIDALVRHGVDAVTCVPGESFLAALDALYDARGAIRVVVCRHEGAAANMAEADAKVTGNPGVCFVTRGPGATHAAVGVHTAMHDSTPMVLFIGQVPRAFEGRSAFQEIDIARTFAPLAKWSTELRDARDIPGTIERAFWIARSERPGPVVIGLPEDVLRETVDVRDASPLPIDTPPARRLDVDRLFGVLSTAQRPLLILGGSRWTAEACADIRTFAAANDLPVACAFRRADLFDNRDPHYAGDLGTATDPRLAERVRAADTIVAIGTRLGDITTRAYTLLDVPRPHQTLVHVHPSAAELGRVYRAAVPIHAAIDAFARALREHAPVERRAWSAWTQSARADRERYVATGPPSEDVDFTAVVRHLSTTLEDDAIVTTGAGNFASWVQRYYEHARYRTLVAPTSGAMGYGVPAAIAAKLRFPERTVVAFTGDGDFSMFAAELGTAVEFGAPIVIVLSNNGMYGTIRMHQERAYPGRPIATGLRNPDFAALARSFGAFGERVEATRDFPDAFARARAAGVPALLDVAVDAAVLSPSVSERA